MTYLLALLHVLAAIGHGYTCWAETHAGGLSGECSFTAGNRSFAPAPENARSTAP